MEKQTGFKRFLKLLAGGVGRLVNLNAMAGEVGVVQSTLTKWLSVLEALKSRLHSGRIANLHFFRDSNGREIDLLYLTDGGVIPVEIKSAMTYNSEFLSGIRYFQKISGFVTPGWLVYAGDVETEGMATLRSTLQMPFVRTSGILVIIHLLTRMMQTDFQRWPF